MKSLFLPTGILLAASLVIISSISTNLFILQASWIALGILVVAFFWLVDWRVLLNHRWFIWGFYLFTVALLVAVYFTAPVVRNTRSWLAWGPLNFQPVELVKVALILVYAQFFSKRHLRVASWQNIFASLLYFAIPAVLVMLQPDLGSTLVLFGIWFGFLLVSGLPRERILIVAIAFLVAGFFVWNYGLKDYHRERIIGVFYPERSILGINYSVHQSKIAIGSAGFWGKGYGQGSQTQLGFLTEPSSDFILAALIEEWGFFAGFLVIGAFLGLVFRVLKIGNLADQNFEKFICLGAAMVFGLHFLLNAGSATGLLPVVGVPFPFLSYGGSNLLTNFILLSIVNAIALRS